MSWLFSRKPIAQLLDLSIAMFQTQKKSQWLQERIESPSFYQNTKKEREMALGRLSDAESFERMFATKFATVKRYGVEGGDSMLPALMSIVDQCGEKDVSSVVIGMPHRGRLNVYTNMMGNPAEEVFAEFSGKAEPPHPWSGDSSYHLACQTNVKTPSGKEVELSLTANPSHLEAVHPVALGTTRAKQGTGKEAMAIIVHGDAAMAGQGVVYEAMGFHHLPKYETGGSIHLVVNNQIGFTTNPHYSRSTRYCCDIAKMAEAPVLHVNGDDVDAVLAATRLAVEWRHAFRQDIFIDLVCYRKNGHNEVDQPSYTQPKMYAAIAKHVPVLTAYANHLVAEGTVSKNYVDQIQRASWERMEKAYAASRGLSPKSKEWEFRSNGLASPAELNTSKVECPPTGAKPQHLSRVAEVVSTYPRNFHIHPNLVKVLQARERMAKEGTSIDWATAEQLAFGTLLLEGKSVRISGQDVERGTFSQRHAVLVDQVTEARHVPLNHMSESQGTFHPCNSHLSEFGVLGFELGYSVASPSSLVLWEAQFGDFSNVAQCMIDQFVASGEQKWLQSTGLAMLLPHGFDGNGPEHSSGRLERYLQLTDEDPHTYPEAAMQHQKINWSVVSCTTPANYFHALRRQVHRPFRKPLVCFNGKGLLRHPLARSTTDDLQEDGPGFQSAYSEQFSEELLAPQKIRTHILCTGQVYLRLLRARQQNNIKDVAISRIEELAPFPFNHVAKYCKSYPNAEIVWCQEEPVNMGAYSHVLPRIETALNHHQLTLGPIRYAGRTASAAVAVGNKTRHLQEDHDLISSALFGSPRPVQSIVNGVPVF
ncbi:2-oxoglutarate dehydrogenase E1 component [Entomophthora muscae]|uniref:2-oxoglutarate dehydrogenase E1 component n=1 Tax=Entomophthora muscae TaxID=34485 RepID=A0ACC2U8L6_9FUNG|nr:2-oxoglutarate dehydrogenase E1 component [Entomophthora muscae]